MEDLHDMDLFTKPAASEDDGVDDHRASMGLGEGDGLDPGGDAAQAEEAAPRRRFAVQPQCAEKVNKLLGAHAYSQRWPLIPKQELWASSVSHPHKPEWRWLLHTRRVGEATLGSHGVAAPVKVCWDCGYALSAPTPQKVQMPMYALANDNWIGRMPFPLAPGGEPLHEMELKSLARGRMCVKKVIAEPGRQGPRDERQGGLRSNSIAFPQATAHVCGSNEPLPPKDAAAAFMRETLIIALAGADVEDLHKAKWAEVRRTPYVDAAEFFTRHDQFYHGSVTVNHDRASTDLQESGSTTEAVLQQAVKIQVAENLPHRMEGPADTGCGGVDKERVVAVDGEAVVEEDGEDPPPNAAIPDPDFPEDVMPALNICADDLAASDLDELQALRKVHAELEALMDSVQRQADDDRTAGASRRRIQCLQHSVSDLLKKAFADKVVQQAGKIKTLETNSDKGHVGYVQGTGSQPLSMYSPEQWAWCFPHLFPYGDGVFGLPRRRPMTFQQCVSYHLVREELAYNVPVEDFLASLHLAIC